MNDEVCTERHKRVDERLDDHNIRLDNHDVRLDKIEQDGRELKTELKNLCKNLKSMTDVMKWFLTVIGGALISFFFYAIQTGIFKK